MPDRAVRRADRKRAVKPAGRRSLGEWLDWQSTLHPRAIDLGLERCRRVRDAMELDAAPEANRPPRIVVAGTNGKGSCVAFLESMLAAAGLRTGAYTSPHLHRYNERVRIAGRAVSDAALVEAFERVDAARGDTSLTFFEFGTLAAADIIERARVDAMVMEVGLGGRLDAVNAFEPSVSLITAIGVDHRAWLGDDRESVGREKAGIMRAHVCCVLGERTPPESVVDHARAVGAPCRIPGRDYGFEHGPKGWRWWGAGRAAIDDLPLPGLAGPHQVDNAAACLAVLDALSPRVEVSDDAVRSGIAGARLAGRLQWLETPRRVLVDVAHNPLGALALAAYLASNRSRPTRRAVCGVLGDKDAGAMLRALAHEIDAWYFASLPGSRGRDARELAGTLPRTVPSFAFDSVEAAFEAALAHRSENEEVVVFGSFVTVQRVLRLATSAICPET